MKKGFKHTEETKDKMSKSKMGQKNAMYKKQFSEEHRKRLSESRKNKNHSFATRKKMSDAKKGSKCYMFGLFGENHPAWKKNKTINNKTIRQSYKYEKWRLAVFERDNYACVKCGKKFVELHADHIKPFALYPESRFDIHNGRTLCRDCHIMRHFRGSNNAE